MNKLYGGLGIAVLLIAGAAAVLFIEKSAKDQSAQQNLPADASELRTLKEKWRQVIGEQGGEKAYTLFVQDAPKNSLPTHSQAHAFGEALYDAEGINGVSACDSAFEFGCYHSFFGVAVHAEGIETLPKFDEACKSKYGKMNLPCQHGIGHGVLVYTDYENIIDALELCETISTLPTGGCSSGVFMEYNFHTMDDSNAGYIREMGENPYEPCDELPQRFGASCYFEQVQWWQSIYSGDFKRIGELCAALEGQTDNYTACYNGIGNYVAAQAAFDFDRIVDMCADMPTALATGLCHEGASWLVFSEKGKEHVAPALCEALEEPYQTQCSDKLSW